MTETGPQLAIAEAKNKELVPVIGATHLHSMHNPRREAEVFASNHMAHLSKSPCALILGLGFGYHIEEIAKILKLKHKQYRIAVIEPHPELVRLLNSYRGALEHVEVFSGRNLEQLWKNQSLGAFLLEKPVVIIHPASFTVSKTYFEEFLARRAPQTVGSWKSPDPIFNELLQTHGASTPAQLVASNQTGSAAAWMRAFWECKHAD